MRYRPFGNTGSAISAVSLALTDDPARKTPQDWASLIYTALEHGINAFEIVGLQPAIIDGVGLAFRNIDRHLVLISLRLGPTPQGRDFSAEGLTGAVTSVLARTDLNYLDIAMLDDPASEELSPEALNALKVLRHTGPLRNIGVIGSGESMDAYITTRAFDVLGSEYNLLSGWKERNRLKAAQERNMPVLAYNFFSEHVEALGKPPVLDTVKRWFVKSHQHLFSDVGTYAFLFETSGWTAEEICLAFALTEPTIATVQITTQQTSRLGQLVDKVEREMPPGVASRIEMARFGAQGLAQSAGKA